MKYRIYYSDGTVRKSEEGPPTGDAARDIQAIVQGDREHGVLLITSTDFYIWRDHGWVGVDWWGLMDFLLDTGLVCFGRMIRTAEYRTILWQASRDREMAEKTGWATFERKP